jgi:hypothetical protein
MDGLGDRRLLSYLYARAVVGAEFVAPVVERTQGALLTAVSGLEVLA